MTTHSPPTQFSSIQGDLGFTYVFVEEMIRQELVEKVNVLQLGLVQLYGDASGTGSDTLRITRYGGVGFAEAFATMATETEAIVPTGFTSGYDEMSIARHGLAKEETYQSRILTREMGVILSALAGKIPNSWLKTLRQKVTTAIASISASSGSAATAWTVDDELDMITAFTETEGFEGGLVSLRHPEQFSDLRDSLRNEPALATPEVFAALQSISPAGGGFNFLGIQNNASFDITQSGGGHVGAAWVPGAVGWIVASTTPLSDDTENAVIVPEFGIVIERSSTPNQATARFDANSWFGVGLLDPSLFPQRKILSINN